MSELISIVVPCYNEAQIVERSYAEIVSAVESSPFEFEFIFADDGSTDDTGTILRRFAAEDPRVRVVSYQPNRGAGFAHRQLYEAARGAKIVALEADLAMHPRESVPALLSALNQCDIAIGSRYIDVPPDYPLIRRIASRTYGLISQTLFGLQISDTQAGFFAFKRNVLDNIELSSDRWGIFVEFFFKAQRQGFRLQEVPLKFVHGTESGQTNMLTEGPRLFTEMFCLWWQIRVLGRTT